jgi:hypothetical protein
VLIVGEPGLGKSRLIEDLNSAVPVIETYRLTHGEQPTRRRLLIGEAFAARMAGPLRPNSVVFRDPQAAHLQREPAACDGNEMSSRLLSAKGPRR